MDWGAVFKFTVVIVGIFAAAMLAIFIFSAVWARIGLGAAILVLIGALYLVKRWDNRRAQRDREKFERSR